MDYYVIEFRRGDEKIFTLTGGMDGNYDFWQEWPIGKPVTQYNFADGVVYSGKVVSNTDYRAIVQVEPDQPAEAE